MSEIFRDRTEGAIARRQDLLRKRRDELVMMPHAIRRVVVARAARVAASLAMIGAGIAMLAVALSPSLAQTVATGLPGINPAVISTFVGAAWILGVVAFAISRGRNEHRFAVEMSSYVLPGQDLDQDIERLSHEHPDEVARRKAHGLEIRSAVLPVAAAAFVMPATLVYVAHAIYAGGWPATANYEANLAEVGSALLAAAVFGLVAALAMTRASARSPKMTSIAGLLALITGMAAAFMLKGRDLPATWVLTVISVISGSIAFVNWRLARERVAIQAEDPAAGSELFTVKDLLVAVRNAMSSARRRVSTPMVVGAGALATLLVCAGSPISTGPKSASAAAAAPQLDKPRMSKVFPTASSRYEVIPTNDGRLRVTVTFADGSPVVIQEGLAGISELPKHWRAHVTIRLENAEVVGGAVAVNPFMTDPSVAALHFTADATEHRFATDVCDDRQQPLGLSIAPVGWAAAGTTVSFLVEPRLELSTNCR